MSAHSLDPLPPKTSAGFSPAFAAAWAGQFVSLVGSGMTTFALGLWVYQTRGAVTDYALLGACAIAPRVALAPVVARVVDSVPRRRVMLGTQAAGALTTLGLLALLGAGSLEIWHVYLAAAALGTAAAFEWPAWSAATTLLVSEAQLARAAGLVAMAQGVADVVAPVAGGALLITFGVGPILALDAGSFLVAVAALALVRFPEPERQAIAARPRISEGWQWLRARPGLLALLGFMAGFNFLWGLVGALAAPLILAFATPGELGMVFSIAGIGVIAGSVSMTVWGGPRRKLAGILTAELISGFAFVAIGIQPNLALVAAGVFVAHAVLPVIGGCGQAIWQSAVPAELQGRVFAVRQAIERAAIPLAYVLAGPLADGVFRPALASGGAAAGLAAILGARDGRGIALMFVLMGLLQIGVAAIAVSAWRRGGAPTADPPRLLVSFDPALALGHAHQRGPAGHVVAIEHPAELALDRLDPQRQQFGDL
jgi:DHA3 family macrolide efflux protein-like MFS transporter